jgi:hypothetical protein
MGTRSRGGRRTAAGRPALLDDAGGFGQYTFEGELNQLGSFAHGARRARGVKGVFAKVMLGWLIVGAVSGPLLLLGYVIHVLVQRHGL